MNLIHTTDLGNGHVQVFVKGEADPDPRGICDGRPNGRWFVSRTPGAVEP